MTVCFCLVCPDPRHIMQGVMMIKPRPLHRLQAERIIKGPVFMDSCITEAIIAKKEQQCDEVTYEMLYDFFNVHFIM